MVVRLLCWRNTTIIHQFLLPQKGLNILRNNSDYKDVDLYNTRKRYAATESSDFMRNISWLASCFSKIKKPNKHCSANQVWLPVFALLTWLLLPLELCFIDFDNNELTGGTTLIQRTIIPCWNNAVGLGSIICHTKSEIKWWKRRPIRRWRTFHQQEGAIKHNGCKRCFEQWWAYAYFSDGKDDSFCHMGFRKVCFERRPTASHG